MSGNWVIIQARMSSTRLPGKVMLPLGNTIVLDYVTKRCLSSPLVQGVVIATTTHSEDDIIEKWCNKNNLLCTRGSKDDVLSRYLLSASKVEPEYLVRVPSDCPFVSFELLNLGLSKAMKYKPDVIKWQAVPSLSIGIIPEIMKTNVLKESDEFAISARYREHVTLYVWEHLENYNVFECKIPKEIKCAKFRLTLDAPADYELLSAVAKKFNNNPLVTTGEVIAFLKMNPQLAAVNKHQKQVKP